MVHRKSDGKGKRRVWRITQAVPQGEYVDPDALPETNPESEPEPHDPADTGWMMSSFALLEGLEVSDESDTVPDELFDELFKQ